MAIFSRTKSKKSRAFLEFRPYSAFNFGGRNRKPKAEKFLFGLKFRLLVYHCLLHPPNFLSFMSTNKVASKLLSCPSNLLIWKTAQIAFCIPQGSWKNSYTFSHSPCFLCWPVEWSNSFLGYACNCFYLISTFAQICEQ